MKIEFSFYKKGKVISRLASDVKVGYSGYLESLERNLSIDSLKDLFSISDKMYYKVCDDLFDIFSCIGKLSISNTIYEPISNIDVVTDTLHTSFKEGRVFFQKDIDYILEVRRYFIDAFIQYLKSAGLILVEEIL